MRTALRYLLALGGGSLAAAALLSFLIGGASTIAALYYGGLPHTNLFRGLVSQPLARLPMTVASAAAVGAVPFVAIAFLKGRAQAAVLGALLGVLVVLGLLDHGTGFHAPGDWIAAATSLTSASLAGAVGGLTFLTLWKKNAFSAGRRNSGG